MKTDSIIKGSLLASTLLIIVGALLKVLHLPFADALLVTGMLFSLVFLFTAIYEVQASNRSTASKVGWILVLLIGGTFGAIFYFINRRSNSGPILNRFASSI